MKIIDAHFHLFPPDPRSEERARAVGHENSADHLRQVYGELGMVHGVIMGNHSLDPAYHDYPADLFHYCVGLDRSLLGEGAPEDYVALVEENLKRESCCGIKLYPGYNRIWLSDPLYEPIYALAERYDKPVAIHMGQTVFPAASLKYAHPLVLDEVAADHPRVRFVMCHFGNPFLESAAAVVEKNPNVCADLSGLLEGRFDLRDYLTRLGGYADNLRSWLAYVEKWDSILYGTDWPIVNLEEYLSFVRYLVPEAHWEKVFFENADRVYGLGL